ncbi:MAG: hypothetical protein KDK78_05825 [Chlamydiia bacterium]|nr:hypothetical protein [Chlamydiia bacterium]
MGDTIQFTNSGLQTTDEGRLVYSDSGQVLLNNLDAVHSSESPVLCVCQHGPHQWSWVRFTPENVETRVAYALDVANWAGATDYRDYHAAAGRILDRRIEGLGGAERQNKEEDLKATVVGLWKDSRVTDAFTLRPNLHAFNHLFGWMGQCAFEALDKEVCAEAGVSEAKDLRVQFAEYGAEKGGEANNGRMLKWFNIAADHPWCPAV